MRCRSAVLLSLLVSSLLLASTARAQDWVARYNNYAPTPSTNLLQAMTVDQAGNTYVTGFTYYGPPPYYNSVCPVSTLKYDPDGKLVWAAKSEGSAYAIAVDSAGCVYVGGSLPPIGLPARASDLGLSKYDGNGNLLWTARYPSGPNSLGAVRAIALDSASNVYLTGYSDNEYLTDCITAKFDANGNKVWMTVYSDESGQAAGRFISLDAAGNVIVAGRKGRDPTVSYLVLKHDASGQRLWKRTYSGAVPNPWSEVGGLALDGAGNIYVTGFSNYDRWWTQNTECVIATLKYDGDGNQIWVQRDRAPGAPSGGRAIAVDGAGNVYVAGGDYSRSGGVYYLSGYVTLKYDANGNPLWRKTRGGGLMATGLVLSGDSVFVTGVSMDENGANSITTIKYDTAGNPRWEKSYPGPAMGLAFSWPVIAAGPRGAIMVGGNSDSTFQRPDFVTIKYSEEPAATVLTVPSLAGAPGKTVTLKALLTDAATGAPLAGKSVSFSVGGVDAGSALTDSAGAAALGYTLSSMAPYGPLPITASFAGDAGLGASSGKGLLTVRDAPTLRVTDYVVPSGTSLLLRARLQAGTLKLPGRTIRFLVDGVVVGTATTDATGAASLPFEVNRAAGKYTLTAEFDGDSEHPAAASNEGSLTVTLVRTSLMVPIVHALPGQSATLAATLRADGVPLAGRTVRFLVDGVDAGSAASDASGLAALSYEAPESLGSYTITAQFAGDGVNAPAFRDGTLTVWAPTRLSADVLKAPAGSPVTFGAKLVRSDSGTPHEGKTLHFYAGTTLLGTAVTDAGGRATIGVIAPARGDKLSITVRFPEDGQHRPASAVGSIRGT